MCCRCLLYIPLLTERDHVVGRAINILLLRSKEPRAPNEDFSCKASPRGFARKVVAIGAKVLAPKESSVLIRTPKALTSFSPGLELATTLGHPYSFSYQR